MNILILGERPFNLHWMWNTSDYIFSTYKLQTSDFAFNVSLIFYRSDPFHEKFETDSEKAISRTFSKCRKSSERNHKFVQSVARHPTFVHSVRDEAFQGWTVPLGPLPRLNPSTIGFILVYLHTSHRGAHDESILSYDAAALRNSQHARERKHERGVAERGRASGLDVEERRRVHKVQSSALTVRPIRLYSIVKFLCDLPDAHFHLYNFWRRL